jgi:hypothetical protein
MSFVRISSAAFFFLLITIAAGAATATQYVVPKDPQAIAIAQRALAAMGGVQGGLAYQDSQANGTLTIYGGVAPVSYAITLKSKGTQETRAEVQMPDGTHVRIVNQGQGVLEKPDGTVMNLLANNTLAERINDIPLFSLLAEYQNSDISVQYQGTAQVNGQVTDIVAISFIPTTDPNQAPIYASMTQTLFFVDESTGLVDKIQYIDYAENGPATENVEVYLGGYQTVSGISVPFHQTTYIDGVLDSDIVLSSVNFNVGLTDAEFALPSGGTNVR